MTSEMWIRLVTALAAVAMPVVVAVLGFRLNRRIKLWEADQWRNQELIRARLEVYRLIAPDLNDLMCFFTFIGSWKELTPPDVVSKKRSLDRTFFSFQPLFSEDCGIAYQEFMSTCFSTYGVWGRDAQLLTSPTRRRTAEGVVWDPAWDSMFSAEGSSEAEELRRVRDAHDALLQCLAADIDLAAPRARYTTEEVVYNAH